MVRSVPGDLVSYTPSPPSGSRPSLAGVNHWSLFRKKSCDTQIDAQVPGLLDTGGIFHRRNLSVDSPVGQVNNEQYLLGERPAGSFLPFGLRQVALPKGPNGQFGLYRPDCQFLKLGRKTYSELDLRRAVLDAPQTRGPYVGDSKFSASLENGLEFLTRNSTSPVESNDTQSETEEMIKHVFNPNEFRQSHNTILRSSNNHYPPPVPQNAPFGYDPETNIYMQNKRHHHRHYFSNLDLFSTSTTYNYLRYAKADCSAQLNSLKQPHLIARNVGFEKDQRNVFDMLMLRTPDYKAILENISFEMRGGETLAIMYTSAEEVSALFGVMTSGHVSRGRCEGSFLVNGLPLRSKHLADRIAYVCTHDLCPRLTVREHLRMSFSFVKPASHAFRSRSMITQLIETLALGPVQNKLVEHLTYSEKQRVKIACKILLDTDFLVLDDITKDMDLYDCAFLIDYLRDWAVKLNRIVIMAINPPTAELLAMFHKVAIISSGRLIYFGGWDKMLNYFDTMNYHCPLFKNPCDYFVDLVTHDYLTVEASIESTDRIRRLADHWQDTVPVLTDTNQIGMLPPKVRKSNPFLAIILIYYRFWLMLINYPWQYLSEFLSALLISFIYGIIYYQLTTAKQGGINDRVGLIYILSTFGLIPNLFCNIDRISHERRIVYQNSIHKLYPRLSYICAKFCFDILLAILVYAVYCTPVYFMAKLMANSSDPGSAYAIFLALNLLNCLALRMLSWACAYAMPNKYLAQFITVLLLCICSLSTGLHVHPNDAWISFSICRTVSPNYWFNLILSQHEFLTNFTQQDSHIQIPPSASSIQLGCDAKEIKIGPILTTLPCPISTGEEAYKFANLTLGATRDISGGFPVMAAFSVVFLMLSICFVHCNYSLVIKTKRKNC